MNVVVLAGLFVLPAVTGVCDTPKKADSTTATSKDKAAKNSKGGTAGKDAATPAKDTKAPAKDAKISK